MILKIIHDLYEVVIYEDQQFSPRSADNTNTYDLIYPKDAAESPYRPSSKYVVKVKDINSSEFISSAILCGYKGASSLHPNAFYLEGSKLWICISDMVYCLQLPNLELVWSKSIDLASVFGIYKFKNDFILHGELEIFRITKAGEVKWSFGAQDIFVSLHGEDVLRLYDDHITVRDYRGGMYKINADGKQL